MYQIDEMNDLRFVQGRVFEFYFWFCVSVFCM